jgi:hypothetical protein
MAEPRAASYQRKFPRSVAALRAHRIDLDQSRLSTTSETRSRPCIARHTSSFTKNIAADELTWFALEVVE